MKGHDKIIKSDGKISVDGEKAQFREGLIRTIHGEINSLKYHSGYHSIDLQTQNKLTTRAQFRGRASFLKDSFSIICNAQYSTNSVPITIEIAPDDYHLWSAQLGFLDPDEELGWGPSWFLSCYVSPDCFNDLLHAYKTNLITGAQLSVGGKFWAADFDQYARPKDPVRWYLYPEKYGASLGLSFISNLSWSYAERDLSPPPAGDELHAEVDKPVQSVAAATVPSANNAPTQYLKAIFAALVAIAAILAFK